MLWRFFHTPGQDSTKDSTSRQGSFRLQVVLWALWTLMVIVVGCVNGYADIVAQRPTNTLGLVIYCTLAGLIGLVVMTVIEIYLEPWRFLDDM
jgi:hypothetical protein